MAVISKETLNRAYAARKVKRVENFSTKYGIDEIVFVLHDNKIQKGIVRQIDCTFQDGTPNLEITILYTLELPEVNKTVQLSEELCFGSKEELKESL